MKEAELFLYDFVLLFYPITDKVAKTLSLTERKIEDGEIENYSRVLYSTVLRDGKECGATYQGFHARVRKTLEKDGYHIIFHDMRNPLPPPRLDLMYGFRFSQEELLTKLLLGDGSGLLSAVTRYGKTTLMVNTIRAYPTLTTCVVAPGVDLVKQLYTEMRSKFDTTGRQVYLVYGNKKPKGVIRPGDIIICSADSLGKIDTTQFRLLLADEPHELVTDTRLPGINSFHNARRLGFGATLTGRFDGRDKLIEGLFGPVLAERTYREAVDEGAICPLSVIFLDVNLMPKRYYNRQRAYDGLFFRNAKMHELIASLCKEVIPADFQTLIFIKNEKQAEELVEAIGKETCIAMAKRLTEKERDELTRKVKENKIKRCLCSKIYVKGMTFSDVRVLINAEAGGNNTSCIQKPGRLAEIRPGKKCGIIIDFFFRQDENVIDEIPGAWRCLVSDSKSREKAYSDKGYDIFHARDQKEVKRKFETLI